MYPAGAAGSRLLVERPLKDAVGLLVRGCRISRRLLGGRARGGSIGCRGTGLRVGVLGDAPRVLRVGTHAAHILVGRTTDTREQCDQRTRRQRLLTPLHDISLFRARDPTVRLRASTVIPRTVP